VKIITPSTAVLYLQHRQGVGEVLFSIQE